MVGLDYSRSSLGSHARRDCVEGETSWFTTDDPTFGKGSQYVISELPIHLLKPTSREGPQEGQGLYGPEAPPKGKKIIQNKLEND